MYPLDRRIVAQSIYSKLQSLRKTAKLLQVCHTTVQRWLKTPEKLPRKKASRQLKSDVIIECIRTTIQFDPFISSRKLQALISETLKVSVSLELIRTAIRRLGFTKKKAKYYGAPSNLEALTLEFIRRRTDFQNAGKDFICIDETSFGRHSYSEARGYTKKGQKLFIRKNTPRMTTVSVIACASETGWVKIKGCKGATNALEFVTFLKSLDLTSNTVVLMDNVRFHHSSVVREFLDSKKVERLYTPPYSPWFNPIELCFSNVKRHFRKEQNIEKAFASLEGHHFASFFKKSMTCEQPF